MPFFRRKAPTKTLVYDRPALPHAYRGGRQRYRSAPRGGASGNRLEATKPGDRSEAARIELLSVRGVSNPEQSLRCPLRVEMARDDFDQF